MAADINLKTIRSARFPGESYFHRSRGARICHSGRIVSMEQPLVTIGIPTLNRSALALRAVRSVLNQTHRNIEVFVSDDLSTDDTVQLVSDIQDSRLVLAKQRTRLGLVANFDFA